MAEDGPGFPVDRRILVIGGVAVLGAAGYIIYRRRKSSSQTSNGAAYGAPLPGSGAITPIFIQPNISQTINPPPSPPKAVPPTKPPLKTKPPPKFHKRIMKGPPHPPTPFPRTSRIYEVQPGDSLSKISQRAYGNANLWPQIYGANKTLIGRNPDLIYPGEELKIP